MTALVFRVKQLSSDLSNNQTGCHLTCFTQRYRIP